MRVLTAAIGTVTAGLDVALTAAPVNNCLELVICDLGAATLTAGFGEEAVLTVALSVMVEL